MLEKKSEIQSKKSERGTLQVEGRLPSGLSNFGFLYSDFYQRLCPFTGIGLDFILAPDLADPVFHIHQSITEWTDI